MSRPTLLLAGGGTGGHVFPLIAVADALSELAPEVSLVFVGTERGMEVKLVPARGYALELMRVLPIRGGGLSGAVRGVWRAMMSVPESRALLAKHAPRAVVSIGGYAAGPISLAARLSRVPLALIEPNSVMGLANRLTVPLVQRAYLAFPQAERHFARGTALATGVPIRAGFEPRPYAPRSGPLQVLVIGGSQGAKSLNETVPEAFAKVDAALSVTHQCGAANADSVRATYQELGGRFAWEVVPFIDDMPAALAAADLVIGRSGASAVSEIAAVGRAALFVPYPYAAGDHQRHNAETLAQAGAAVSVAASEATAERLAKEVERLAKERGLLERMAAASMAWGRPNAARDIAHDLLRLAGLAHIAGAAAPSEKPPTPDNGASRLLEVPG
ncbi:MAG: undecaprenyldiphospho-muramoylpentapeptide beta-N-acetylglucosaminyltransferase [Myxococcales bacterium]|nr:undecaprenyldiphospho-muramoylpentapeptide beta-N-acetylglucosaminyltransferase [Myxococcales bacterium]